MTDEEDLTRLWSSVTDLSDVLEGLMAALDGVEVAGTKEQMIAYTEAWGRAYDVLAGEAT